MSHCIHCRADMHPIDARQNLVCDHCRKERKVRGSGVRELYETWYRERMTRDQHGEKDYIR